MVAFSAKFKQFLNFFKPIMRLLFLIVAYKFVELFRRVFISEKHMGEFGWKGIDILLCLSKRCSKQKKIVILVAIAKYKRKGSRISNSYINKYN